MRVPGGERRRAGGPLGPAASSVQGRFLLAGGCGILGKANWLEGG